MKARTYYMAAFIVAAALLCLSCGTTISKFVKQTGDDRGAVIASAELDQQTMADAARYACKKMGIVIESETVGSDGAITILSTLKSSMQDWGQNIKITVAKNVSQCDIWYLARPRIKMNVTADIATIYNNFHIHLTTYIEAAKEGIDLDEI